jgi:hypothetical protein
LAVLGFLSLCTFIVSQTHFFESLASDAEEGEELFEMAELMHYGLFFIIIKFALNVCVLIAQAKEIQSRWQKFETLSRTCEPDKIKMQLNKKKRVLILRRLFPTSPKRHFSVSSVP